MAEIDYRQVWFENELIGFIAQDQQGRIFVRGKNLIIERTLKTFKAPIKIDETTNEGDISISSIKLVLHYDPEWLSVIEFGIPADYFVTPIEKTTIIKFSKMKFGD